MAERAHITSVEALEAFRSQLIVYLSKARPTLDEAGEEVIRTRMWLQHDQRTAWEREIRRRTKLLEQAQQALFSAELAKLREATDAERTAVTRAKRALAEAEERLKQVKGWIREYDSRVEPLAKQLDGLRTMLTTDMPKAVAHLGEIIKTLQEYAGLTPSFSADSPTGPTQAPGEPAGKAPQESHPNDGTAGSLDGIRQSKEGETS